MCTLIIAHGMSGGPDLYVISNRDEVLDRPAQPPELHRREAINVFAPRDALKGGTWLGLNEMGVFAGITNRFGLVGEDHHRSRGHLVFRALQMPTARSGRDAICELSAGDYNGFHLVIADGITGWVIWSDKEAIRSLELAPGFYVVSERSLGAAPSARLERLATRLAALSSWSEEHRPRFRTWMSEHDEEDPLEGACIHAESRNYGTRSSTVVELGQTWRFLHADGPPCSTPYQDYSASVESMR